MVDQITYPAVDHMDGLWGIFIRFTRFGWFRTKEYNLWRQAISFPISKLCALADSRVVTSMGGYWVGRDSIGPGPYGGGPLEFGVAILAVAFAEIYEARISPGIQGARRKSIPTSGRSPRRYAP